MPIPPGPRSRIPGRVFKELRADPLAFLTKYAQVHGDIHDSVIWPGSTVAEGEHLYRVIRAGAQTIQVPLV